MFIVNSRFYNYFNSFTHFMFVECHRFSQKCIGYAPSVMSAWQLHKYKIENLSLSKTARVPIISSPNDILVEVKAASVNPIDLLMLNGYASTISNIIKTANIFESSSEFPLILGRDFSGVVVNKGKKVESLIIGDEVWGILPFFCQGSHADYALTKECWVAKKPVNLSHEEASSIPYAGLSAWSSLCITGNVTEKNCNNLNVLVLGGSGGVGSLAVQFLNAWGAQVATVCHAESMDLLLKLGAAKVYDFQSSNFDVELKNGPKYDLILDAAGQGHNAYFYLPFLKYWKCSKFVTLSSPLIKNVDDYGLIVGSIFSVKDLIARNISFMSVGTTLRWAYCIPINTALLSLVALVEKNQVKPVLQKTISFSNVPQAYSLMETKPRIGKIVISRSLCVS